jgi:hypothetical protein
MLNNPALKRSGLQSLINPAFVQEQLRRNISRPWYVDSGCSRHMTGDLSQLSNIQEISNDGYAFFAGGEKGKITQMGIVTNGTLQFDRVNYVPELQHSLLSVSQICDKDFSTHFTKKECLILKPGIVIPEDWNKQDDSGVIVRNKARLVVRGFRQIEGLDYTEVYAPVARLEAIRIFLAYASYMGFTVYQMDAASTT